MSFKNFLALTFIICFSLFFAPPPPNFFCFFHEKEFWCLLHHFFLTFFEPNEAMWFLLLDLLYHFLPVLRCLCFCHIRQFFSVDKYIFILKCCISVWFLLSSSLDRIREQRANSFCFHIFVEIFLEMLHMTTFCKHTGSPWKQTIFCSFLSHWNSNGLRTVVLLSSFPCSWTFCVFDNEQWILQSWPNSRGFSASFSRQVCMHRSCSVTIAFRCRTIMLLTSTVK